MTSPTALVVTAPGTNRDPDVTFALETAGASVRSIPISDPARLRSAIGAVDVVVVAGGFSYADALGAGRVFALELEHAVGESITSAVEGGALVIGICNGFQTLVRLGILPGGGARVALAHNEPGGFQCRWVRLRATSERCVWTRGLTDEIDCPIAHGEGRFVCDDTTMEGLVAGDQIALRYVSPNPNGSRDAVAGICDPTGRVLGLMPHPENHVLARQHPRHRRGAEGRLGLALFRAGVAHVRR